MRIERRMGEWTQEVESYPNEFGQTCWRWYVHRELPDDVRNGTTKGWAYGFPSRELAEASAARFMSTDGTEA